LNPSLPLDLETICLSCLEKEPAKRYPNAQEFAEELGRFLRDEPIRARPVTSFEKTVRWCRRKPLVASLVTVVALLLVAVTVSSVLAARRVASARNAARQSLYAADMKQVQQAWDSGNSHLASTILKAQIPQRGQEDLRGFEWRYFSKLCQGEQEFVFQGHTNPVRLVGFAVDGERIFSHSSDGVFNVWDRSYAEDRPIKQRIFLPLDVGAALSADGAALATTAIGEIRLLNPMSLQEVGKKFSINSRVSYDLALSSNHHWLAALIGNHEICVWDITSEQVKKRNRFGEQLQSIGISLDLLAVGGERGLFRLWNLAADKELTAQPSGNSEPISSIVFSPDQQTVALISGSTIQLLILSTNPPTCTTLRPASIAEEPASLGFSTDGLMLAVGTFSGTIELWDVPGLRRTRSFRGHSGRVNSVAFSRDSHRLVSGGEDTTVRQWCLTAASLTNFARIHLGGRLSSAALAPDGRTVALGSTEGTITLWDTTTRSARVEFESGPQPVLSLDYSPEGRILASANGDAQDILGAGEVRLWDATTGRAIAALPGLTNRVSAVAFSPDGKNLAVACPYAAQLWDVTTLRAISMFSGHQDAVRAIAFAPDGHTLATGSSDKSIRLWNRPSNTQKAVLDAGADAIRCVTFSRDGGLMASSGDGLSIQLWDIKSRKCLSTLDGHKVRTVSALAFSPDAQTLASGGADGTVRLWNITAQREVATLDALASVVIRVFFSQDGMMLLSVASDGTVCWWDAPGMGSVGKGRADAEAIARGRGTKGEP
jgi:WD40 repeat protein